MHPRSPALILLAVLLNACGGGAGTGSAPIVTPTPPAPAPVTTPGFSKSSQLRAAAPQASDADLASVVAGNTDFALKALQQFDPANAANTVFSPYSITEAVALTAAGAKGNTLAGIAQALSITLPQERYMPALNKLDLALTAETTGLSASGDTLPHLNVVNALWTQQGYSLLPTYLDAVAINYGAGVHQVDFINAAEAARLAINGWVSDNTNKRITDLLAPGAVGGDTRLVLSNAIWFKGNWQSAFDARDTRNQSFHLRGGGTVEAPFMNQLLTVPYGQGAGYQALDLPYTNGNLSMLMIMPDAGTVDNFIQGLSPARLAAIVGGLGTQRVTLSMPKFSFSATPPLGATLKNLGMVDAFSTSADFSGIDGTRNLSIGGALHKAFISVDENGTEAAASTAIIVIATSVLAGSPVPMTLDRPFVFVIRDRQSGLVLFIGKVMTPL